MSFFKNLGWFGWWLQRFYPTFFGWWTMNWEPQENKPWWMIPIKGHRNAVQSLRSIGVNHAVRSSFLNWKYYVRICTHNVHDMYTVYWICSKLIFFLLVAVFVWIYAHSYFLCSLELKNARVRVRPQTFFRFKMQKVEECWEWCNCGYMEKIPSKSINILNISNKHLFECFL
jgi:hypothetical protein